MKSKLLSLLMFLLLGVGGMNAQKVALKTNLLYDALATANLGIETGLSPRWTLDISGNLNAWNLGKHRMRHWLVQPEVRYWLCDRFQGHFFSLHAIAGQFNFGNLPKGLHPLGLYGLDTKRYQGWMEGAGIAYGYSWILSRHWNIEAELGLGWIHSRSDVYPCAECGTKIDSRVNHDYVGPTKLAVNLIYLF